VTSPEDFAAALRQAASLVKDAADHAVAARQPTFDVAGGLQEAFSGSSNSSAESAIEASQRACQLLDDAIGLLKQARADVADYMGDVLGQHRDASAASVSRPDEQRGPDDASGRRSPRRRRQGVSTPRPDEKVSEVLRRKKGSIKNAPLGRGSPSWDELSKMDLRDIEAGARANKPGYKTALKLLRDRRFDR
jgi:hypothetical protein